MAVQLQCTLNVCINFNLKCVKYLYIYAEIITYGKKGQITANTYGDNMPAAQDAITKFNPRQHSCKKSVALKKSIVKKM